MVDCTLIFPYLEEANWKNELRSKDNLALGYLASSIRQENFSVTIIHAELHKYSINEIKQILIETEPKSVGLSCTAQRSYTTLKAYAKMIKENFNIPVFIGGIFPTVAYKEILNDCPYIDFVSLGEGEIFIKDFLKILNSGENYKKLKGLAYRDKDRVVVNGPISVVEDLDTLPYPAKDFLDEMKEELESGLYYINVSAGRGCFGKCSFCSCNKLTGTSKRRVRSVNNVVDELEYLQKKYKTNYFKFVDELFIDKTNVKWIYDFCEEVKNRKLKIKFHAEARVDCISEPVISSLKSAGLDEVFVGFESGNLKVLNRYKKGHTPEMAETALEILNKYDINVEMGYIMIDPVLSFEQLSDNVHWLLKIGGYSKHNLYNKMNLYYGTDLYELMKYQQLNNDSAFYDRKYIRYLDVKVEIFAQLVEYAKEEFSSYNVSVNSFILKIIKEGKYKEAWRNMSELLSREEAIVWSNIILMALEEANRQNKDKNYWHVYINNQLVQLEKYFKILKCEYQYAL